MVVDVLTLQAINGSPERDDTDVYQPLPVGNEACHGGHPPVEKQGFQNTSRSVWGSTFRF